MPDVGVGGSVNFSPRIFRQPQCGRVAHSVKRRASFVLLLAWLIVVLGVTASASAHATLEGADPAPGSRIRTLPEIVTARFSQEVNPDGSRLLVAAPDGSPADIGDGGADLHDPDRLSLSATLKPNLPDGRIQRRLADNIGGRW